MRYSGAGVCDGSDEQEPDGYQEVENVAEYDCKSTMKLNASPVGGARIMRKVKDYFKRYGRSGVAKGRVEAQARG